MERLKGKLLLSGIFTSFSGISIGQDRIGSGNSSLARLVVRHPICRKPFIPGSSFRGAVRRQFLKNCPEDREIQGKKPSDSAFFNLFGSGARTGSFVPGKTVFRDVFLAPQSLAQIKQQAQQSYLSEIKIHAGMDRITSQGVSYAVEQIPAGAQFNFEILFSIYQSCDFDYLVKLLECLQCLEDSSLGAHGSRGCGQIKFGKWDLDDSLCLGQEPVAGISLGWRSPEYYTQKQQETVLVKAEEKMGPADMVTNYDRIVSAIK